MRASIRRAPKLAAVAALAMIVAFSVAAFSFWSGHKNGCVGRDKTLNVLHDLLKDAEAGQTVAERKHSHSFFVKEFARIAAARC